MSDIVRVPAAEGIELAVEVQGDGPPLLLVHGITEDRTAWMDIPGELASDWRVHAVDLRGHGQSTPTDTGDLASMAGDLAAVIATLGLEAPILIGHSLGGAVVSAVAASMPTGPVINVDQPLLLAEFQAGLQALEPQLRGDGFQQAMEVVWDGLGFNDLPADIRHRLDAFHDTANPALVLSIWDQVFSSSAEELDGVTEGLLGQIQVPYLSLHGVPPPDGYAEWLTGLVPTATVEVWDGGTHWLHLKDTPRFLARIREFLL